LTLSGDLHHQGERDLDEDRWSDVAEFTRGSIRPRLFVNWPSGDALFATGGFMNESREGGYAEGSPENYRERLETTRWDGGISATRATFGGGRLTGRLAGVHLSTDHGFGDIPERNRQTTFYSELNYAWGRPHFSLVGGAVYQHDEFKALDVGGFDYSYSVPALFAQATVDPAGWVSFSLSGRCDFHNVYGTRCSPRAAFLLKPFEEWTARISGGGGFFAPTPLTEDTEPLGLHALVPATLEIERARNVSFDLSWKHGPLELSGTLAASRLHDRVDLAPVLNDPLERLHLVNVTAGPSDIVAGELFGVYEAKPIVVTAFYGYLHATEADVAGTGRHETALTPRTSLGIDVTWEAPETTGTWIAVEAFYTGTQALDDNPYRTRSEDYTVMEVLISQRIGHVRLYLNGENLLDARQTRYDPLPLPQPGLGGRRTVKPWAPLQGRVISIGALIGW
jgi:iron complex outermembrane receptor protein